MIKAEAIAKLTEAIVLADDSGLEIDYLNKEPGIYSARYAGTDTSYEIKNNLLLQRLEGVPDEQSSKITYSSICGCSSKYFTIPTPLLRFLSCVCPEILSPYFSV